jgi:3-hydroxyisobutyrate dehydrogenase
MGKTIVHQGAAGAGQHSKMCNQIAIASNMIGVMEALVYARKAGLDPEVVLQSIGAGAAGSWSLSNLYPRVVAGDLGPGFYVEHFLKDIRIALGEAQRMGVRLPGLELAERLYQQVVDEGGARLGTQALVTVLEG